MLVLYIGLTANDNLNLGLHQLFGVLTFLTENCANLSYSTR